MSDKALPVRRFAAIMQSTPPDQAASPKFSHSSYLEETNRPMICYVINLERHPARLQSFLKRFDRSDLSAAELRRVRAVDAACV